MLGCLLACGHLAGPCAGAAGLLACAQQNVEHLVGAHLCCYALATACCWRQELLLLLPAALPACCARAPRLAAGRCVAGLVLAVSPRLGSWALARARQAPLATREQPRAPLQLRTVRCGQAGKGAELQLLGKGTRGGEKEVKKMCD